MEFIELVRTITASRRTFIAWIIVGVLFGSLAADTMQGRLQAHATVLIIQTKAQNTKDYAYDSFYVLETTERLAKSLVLYLRRPDVLSSILGPKSTNRSLRFSAFGDQGISIAFTPISREEGETLYDKLTLHLTKTFESLFAPTAGGTMYDLKFGPLLVRPYQAPQLFMVLVGAIAGAVGSTIFLIARAQMTSRKTPKTRRHENRS